MLIGQVFQTDESSVVYNYTDVFFYLTTKEVKFCVKTVQTEETCSVLTIFSPEMKK